jgi:hypothetical protein
VDPTQASLLGGQVGGRVLLGGVTGGGTVGAGEAADAGQVERLRLGERPGERELRWLRHEGWLRLREGLQVDAGRLAAEFFEVRYRCVPLGLLFGAFRLAPGAFELGRGGADVAGTRGTFRG